MEKLRSLIRWQRAAWLLALGSLGLHLARAQSGFDWPGPTLRVTRSDRGIVLSWPISTDPHFFLEYSRTGEASSWCAVGQVPVRIGGCWQFTVPASEACGWFRLHRAQEPLKIRSNIALSAPIHLPYRCCKTTRID
jgi:hypothetical protein